MSDERIREGDLALMIIHNHLYGKFCTVLSRASVGNTDSLGCKYIAAERHLPVWYIQLNTPINSRGKQHSIVLFYERYLKRIPPLGELDEVPTEREVAA
jgi:hypothetical protein